MRSESSAAEAGSSWKTTLSISRMMTLSACVVVAVVAAFAAFNAVSFLDHRIGSARFQSIQDGSELIADYLSPPLVPFEAFSLVHLTRDTPNADITKQVAKWKELQKSFEERLQHWDHRMASSPFLAVEKWKPFRDGIADRGNQFWSNVNKEIIPAFQNGDMAKADSAISELTAQFVTFVNFVGDNQGFIGEDIEQDKKDSLKASDLALKVCLGLAVLLCTALTAIFIAGNRLVVRALVRIAEVMSDLANGNLNVSVPYEARRDEVGDMARAVSVFKSQAQDNKSSKDANEYVISNLGDGLNRVSSGDLTRKINEPFPPALDALRVGFNSTVEALQNIIANVRRGAEGISSGTAEISIASDDLSRRTENQAANLEQTAAAVAEITHKVQETASGATHARNIVSLAKEDADKSSVIVDRAISAMKAIEDSSRRINQIIGVMDEMAFQTNLLALNAGVEAARAGDAGRGFAVVASEVRALAQRSAEAASEIKDQISTAQTAVADGVHLVAESGISLRSIIERISEINRVVSEIASSAEQQAVGLQEVNIAVEQMDMVTQQNAAMVEETTAATRTLTEQSSELARIVSRFTVRNSTQINPREANTSIAA
jgi:methyl-accepting chemotaxis protein